MSIESIIGQYGYIAIVIGTFFEGETILILGGIFAYRGYFSFPLVILCAFAGTLIGDQLYFFLGRKRGYAFIAKRPYLKRKIEKFQKFLTKYYLPVILGFRFLYGLRTVAPFVIGLSKISFITFFILNIISAAVWAGVIGTLGFYFGRGIEILLDDIKKYEIFIIIAGALVILLRIFFIYLKRKQSVKNSSEI